ncbi:lipopolysaccharide biosynthesis protein [Paenibacillus sp. BC26]|uniref:lipopolysaccharide biosynthesis protein n=1 Tax=Paenibacillus sp. BC26 TaxID=1881032 RepID=UPI0008F30EC1|nr:polysaccharide biosynthesis C-terminal domain-containing protein [Paenibacillus sp. BC26]SFT25346.1 Na+-driven multidrug efflux pump [Paenibacillus sp. BC26]
MFSEIYFSITSKISLSYKFFRVGEIVRSKKAILNIAFSLSLQLLLIVSGFIIPKLLIGTFGSFVNGLTTSITQFMGYLTLLQSGVGSVVIASLYKPLSKGDMERTSSIINATTTFFRKIAYITVIYVCVIAMIYPLFLKNGFNYFFIATLVIIIGIGTFAQYYFGITYQLLLQADQKSYIYSIFQMCSLVLNTILVIVLIKIGAGIHLVLLGSSMIYLFRPVIISLYIKKKYRININRDPDQKAIEQRWDGFGHTIAYFITSKSDIMLITVFLNLKEVSVYSIYSLVTNGIMMLITTISTSIQAAFGNMIAKEEYKVLQKSFKYYECLTHIIVITFFTSGAILIIPFVSIYSSGFNDANYIRPVFAAIMMLAAAVYCIRLPYHTIIKSAGHFKQTRNGAFIEALINVLFSMLLLHIWGIVGVALGTLLAMVFRTIDYVLYLKNNIIFIKIGMFIKRVAISFLNVTVIIVVSKNIHLFEVNNLIEWFGFAAVITIFSFLVTLSINLVFYRDVVNNLYKFIVGLKKPAKTH